MLKPTTLFFFIFFLKLLYSQNTNLKIRESIDYKENNKLYLTTKFINKGDEQLVNLRITNSDDELIFKNDSIYCSKNISVVKFLLDINFNSLNNNYLKTEWFTIDNKLISKNDIKIPIKSNSVSIINLDTSVSIRFNEKTKLSVNVSDSAFISNLIIDKDTLLQLTDIIKNRPLNEKLIEFKEVDDKIFDTLYYKNGRFFDQPQVTVQAKPDSLIKPLKHRKISGNVYIENNSFSSKPEHAQNSQYPNTIIRINNSINLFSVPIKVNFAHNTSNSISPDFKNFVSVNLDVDQLRTKTKSQILEDQNSKQYDIKKIQPNIEEQNRILDQLYDLKSLLEKYPNSDYDIDSLFKEEIQELKVSERLDSSINNKDSTNTNNHLEEAGDLDQLKIDSTDMHQMKKIDNLISRYQKSIATKEKFKNIDKNHPIEKDNALSNSNLYKYYEGDPINNLLLRFDKLQFGNFYEYAGEYSIRDIEIFGLNSKFNINSNNSIYFLTGKINDFQTFNLDNSGNENKRISSIAFANNSHDFLNYTIRFNQSFDKSTSSEIPRETKHYVVSTKFNGVITNLFNYEIDFNKSSQTKDESFSISNDFLNNSAFKSLISITPFKQLEFEFKFDKVGENYYSDGVYFLRRNFEEFGIANKTRLFKNKLIIRTEYSNLKRNTNQEYIKNGTNRWFFDISTRFKRIPNIQIIHSPISVEIANKFDTTFSNLNAFSRISIIRLSYLKRIKRTFINSSIIYNEISNDIENSTDRQKSSQIYASISNKKVAISLTSSFTNIFNQIRFISLNYSQVLSTKFKNQLYVAKNINIISPYSWTVRNKIEFQANSSFLIGGGIIGLIDNKTQIGTTISLSYTY
jgi:hypothetical protein